MVVQNAKPAAKSDPQATGAGNPMSQKITSEKPVIPSTGPPEPIRATSPNETDEDEDEDEEDEDEDEADTAEDALITPPSSVKKGPTTSKAPVAKVPAAKAPAASAKRSSGVVKKSGAVKGSNVDGVKADTKSGANAKAVKGDNKPSNGLGTAKSPSNPTDAQKSAVVTTVDDKSASIMDPAVFTTQIFDIFTGPTKGHFMAHEAVLTQSPLIARLIQTHSTKKGKLKTTLVFPRESPANFGVLLGYLYSHQLVMPSLNGEGLLSSDTDGTEAKAAAKLLARLYVLAHNYEMDGMQERITRVLEDTGLMERIPGLEFFELAEKLYPDDAEDAEDDEFAKHFVKVAPGLIRDIPDKDLPELMRMVSAGGAFAEAIFLAYNVAVKSGFSAGGGEVRIKREYEDEVYMEGGERARKRARGEGEGEGDGEGGVEGDAI